MDWSSGMRRVRERKESVKGNMGQSEEKRKD